MRRVTAIVVLSALGLLGGAGAASAACQPAWQRAACFRTVHVGVALGSTVTETTRTCATRHGYRTTVTTVVVPLGY